jgi:hypothetical protein
LCAWIMLERTKSSRNEVKVLIGDWISTMNSQHKIHHSKTIWLNLDLLANHGRALMHCANVPMNERHKMFCEAFKTATLLDGLIPI